MTVVCDDFDTGAAASHAVRSILANQITGGVIAVRSQGTGGRSSTMPWRRRATPTSPNVTDFPVNVNITDPRFLSVSDLTSPSP